jgi:hypothetical protein
VTTQWLVPPDWADTVPVGQSMLNRLSTDLTVLSTRTLYGEATEVITLTTSWADVPGATVTIAVPGFYRIRAVFYFRFNSADGFVDDDFLLYGTINVSTSTPPEQNPIAICKLLDPMAMTARQQWAMDLEAGAIVKLVARKTGGKGGSEVRDINTILTATLRGRSS